MTQYIEHPLAYQNATMDRIRTNAMIGNYRKMPAELVALLAVADTEAHEVAKERTAKMISKLDRDIIKAQKDSTLPSWFAQEMEEERDEKVAMLAEMAAQPSTEMSIVSQARNYGASSNAEKDSWEFQWKLILGFVAYGKISEKQMVWVLKLTTEIPARRAGKCEADEERKAERATLAAGSEFVGEEKVRMEFTATVEFFKWFENAYGSTALIRMRDADGNCIVWWASNPPHIEDADGNWSDPAKGTVLTGKGTVKKHEVYEGEKQTTMTRCKLEIIS